MRIGSDLGNKRRSAGCGVFLQEGRFPSCRASSILSTRSKPGLIKRPGFHYFWFLKSRIRWALPWKRWSDFGSTSVIFSISPSTVWIFPWIVRWSVSSSL